MNDKRKLLLQKLAALGGLLLLIVIFSFTSDSFFSVNNIMTVGLQTSTIAFIGIGVTCVILTGGIDLSIGSIVALSGVAAGLAVNAGMPVSMGLLLGVLTGSACGLVNGVLVTTFRLPPFIATLGTMMILRGLALYVTDAAPVSGMPDAFGDLGNGSLFRIVEEGDNGLPHVIFPGIPYPVILMIVAAVLFTFALTKMRMGRYLYAIGSNEEAARLSGLRVKYYKLLVYVISGFTASFAGLIFTSRVMSGQPNAGVGFELDAIAAVVLGGASIAGGRGMIIGTLIGAMMLGVLNNGLNLLGISPYVQYVVKGLIIWGATFISSARR